MSDLVSTLEAKLNDFDAESRREALQALADGLDSGAIGTAAPVAGFNLHAHSFFSFNGYGYSPSYLAWLARRDGYRAMGLVDFDVLDGVEEFLAACRLLGVRACASIESRVFVPAFGDRVINSPGEPGIAYHMGVGFVSGSPVDTSLLERFGQIAQSRNRELTRRVNAYLSPIALDYEADVLSRTPAGNATERHVCAAYDDKARVVFPELEARMAFWSEKLGLSAEALRGCIDNAPVLQGHIRAKTMKSGGVGYVAPNGPDFPGVDDMNAFARANGAIPTLAWLDGTSAGEACEEELFDVMVESGVAMVNIIPDRNWNIKDPGQRGLKVAKLNSFIREAQRRHLPIVVGTELNAHGQRLVDDFDAPAMKPHYDAFLEGAHIAYAHTLLQRAAGMGYLSNWAAGAFTGTPEKNAFFAALGGRAKASLDPAQVAIEDSLSPEEVFAALAAGA